MRLNHSIIARPPYTTGKAIHIPEGASVKEISRDGVEARIAWDGAVYIVDADVFDQFAEKPAA